MGEAERLFITLPAEVWAIALKPSCLSREEAAAEEETTCRGMTARELPATRPFCNQTISK